jgi:hypothetical protein
MTLLARALPASAVLSMPMIGAVVIEAVAAVSL